MNEPVASMHQKTVSVSAEHASFAGFWIRAAAFIIDCIIISIPVGIISMPFVGYAAFKFMPYLDEYSYTQTVSSDMAAALFLCWGIALFLQLLGAVIFWLYFAWFESSVKQATWGKQLFGLRVTDAYGQRLTFARATGRTFAKILSYMTLYIGFMMAGWTKQKRALHDMIAGTLVMKIR